MLRISWPLALLLAAVIAIVARRPRLFWPMVIVFGIWFAWQLAQRPRGPDRRPLDRRGPPGPQGPGRAP